MSSEFQAVILAAGRGSRMYPLTEECPKALLTVGNYPLIWYPVNLLDKNGFDEVLVVVRDSQSREISDVLAGFRNVKIKFSMVEIPEAEDWGTADSLRHLRGKIKSDVLLLSCDLITTVPLRQFTDFHRVNDSTLTMLLVRDPVPDAGGSKSLVKKKETIIVRDIVGLAGESRLVYFTAQADLDEHMVLSRSMLRKHPHIRMCTQLSDSHLYLIKKWVVDFLGENKSLSSVKGELLPYLVRQQSMTANNTYKKPIKQALQRAALSCVDSLEQQAYELSSFAGYSGGSDPLMRDLIRCHALIVDKGITTRVNTVSAFTEANRTICHHLGAFSLEKPSSQPSWRSKGVSISPDSLVAATVQVGEKVSVKKACIGGHCSIGDRSKIINCVIMDHVHIGEGCSLQGCVVCSHARIEDKVTLKDCHVGANFTITKEADMRGETLVVDGGLHF